VVIGLAIQNFAADIRMDAPEIKLFGQLDGVLSDVSG
jgi:hypothetical protein